jgi:hypothetical protein
VVEQLSRHEHCGGQKKSRFFYGGSRVNLSPKQGALGRQKCKKTSHNLEKRRRPIA